RFTSMDEAIAALGMGRGQLWTPDYFDHEKEMEQTSVGFETIASATGGNDSGSYSGSMLVRNEPGVIKSTFAEKQSAKLGVIYNFGDKLNVNVSTNLIHSLSDRGLTNNDNTGTSMYVALSSTPSFVDLRKNPDGTYPANPGAQSNPLQTAALLEN